MLYIKYLQLYIYYGIVLVVLRMILCVMFLINQGFLVYFMRRKLKRCLREEHIHALNTGIL